MKTTHLNIKTTRQLDPQQPELLTAVVTTMAMVANEQQWQVNNNEHYLTATRAPSCLLRPLLNDTVLCVQLDQQKVVILAVLARSENTPQHYDFSPTASISTHDDKLSLTAPQLEIHGNDSTQIDTPMLNVWVNHAAIAITNLHYRGENINNQTKHVKHHYQLLEQEIETSQLTAKTVLETIMEAKHQILGNAHTLVQQTYRVDCGHATIYADDDVTIQGKQININ